MSGLSYICEYGNESDSDDCETGNNLEKIKRLKLPVPDLSHIPVVLSEQHLDNLEHHKGRIRSFPHVRGNWATFVYIKYPDEESLLILANKLRTSMLDVKELLHICDDFHLSLSKTVVLNYHTIVPFTQSLKEVLSDIKSFYLCFNTVDVFCNEEKTRTFIVLRADYSSIKSLTPIVKKIDDVLEGFNLEKFYDDPSFHISLFWTKGDQRKKLEAISKFLNNNFSEEIGKKLESVIINRVNCKSGNKFFQFLLT